MKKYETFMITLEGENEESIKFEVLAKDTEDAQLIGEKYRGKCQRIFREKFQITNIEKK